MKEYLKPEVEFVDFATEDVATSDNMGGESVSANVPPMWGNN